MNLYDILDNATAMELDPLLAKFDKHPLPADVSLDRVKSKVCGKIGLSPASRKRRPPVRRLLLLAACIALTLGAIVGIAVYSHFKQLPSSVGDDPSVPLHSPEDLSNDFDMNDIVWGTEPPAAQSPIGPGETTPSKAFVQWNGLKITQSLYEKLLSASDSAVFAITAESLEDPDVKMTEFLYNGKTWDMYWDEFHVNNDLRNDLHSIKRLLSFPEALDQAVERLIEARGEAFVLQYQTNGEFDLDKIDADIEKYTQLRDAAEQAREDLVDAYYAQYMDIVDLSGFAEAGYYVIENTGRYYVFLTADQFAELSRSELSAQDPSLIENSLFKLANREFFLELG